MSIKEILKGHINEVLGTQQELSDKRMDICKNCPLFKDSSFGPICNPGLYLDKQTNTASERKLNDAVKGCGCRLNAKTRLEDAHCPADKW